MSNRFYVDQFVVVHGGSEPVLSTVASVQDGYITVMLDGTEMKFSSVPTRATEDSVRDSFLQDVDSESTRLWLTTIKTDLSAIPTMEGACRPWVADINAAQIIGNRPASFYAEEAARLQGCKAES